MAAASESSIASKFPPLTKENVLFYYFPMQGMISYAALSVNVMSPALVVKVFPKKDITNVLLINTLVGSGLYIYSRPHLQKALQRERVLYSVLGASLYCFGSVLIWAITRSMLPKCSPLCAIVGVGSGMVITKLSHDYLTHVDSSSKN